MRPIDVEVDLCDTGGEYFLQPRLNVSLPAVFDHLRVSVIAGRSQSCEAPRWRGALRGSKAI